MKPILIFRCSRLPHFAKAVARIRTQYPDREIHVLAKASLAGESGGLPGVTHVVSHPEKPFSLLKTMPWAGLRLRNHSYDLVVLPVSTSTRTEYMNVEFAALMLRFNRIAVFTPDGRWREHANRSSFYREVLKGVSLVCAERADAPILFALLIAANLWRPFRWIRARIFGSSQRQNRPHRIMHCISSLGLGGAQRQMLKVMKVLASRYNVSLCMLNGDDLFFGPALERIQVRSRVLNPNSHSYTLSVFRLRSVLREERIDTLHTWLPQTNVIGALAGFLAGTPCIVTSERNITCNKLIWYPQWWFRWADALAARLCTVISTNANAVREDFISYTRVRPDSVAVIYNGSEEEEFERLSAEKKWMLRERLGLPETGPVIGLFGRLEPEKDHGTFLRAVQRVRREIVGLSVLIAGGGSRESQIKTMAKEMDLWDCVRFLGNRPDATSLMQICDVVVLSSTSEGMPNALLEAQHLGIPVVTTDAGGSREIVSDGETGFVVPIGDDLSLAAGICTILTSPDLARRFADAASAWVRNRFSLEQTVDGFEALYHRGENGPVPPRMSGLRPELSK